MQKLVQMKIDNLIENIDIVNANFFASSDNYIETDTSFEYKNIKIINGDMFDNICLPSIENHKIDAVITDFPYGTLNKRNNWDKIIDYKKFWKEYYRICKETAPLISTAQI